MDKSIIELFFPKGILEYFEVVSYNNESDTIIFHLKEMNIPPKGYKSNEIESKGFFNEETVTDFPLRGKGCVYKIKRRKWLRKKDGGIISRDWNIVAKGTRITNEFATFLKGTLR